MKPGLNAHRKLNAFAWAFSFTMNATRSQIVAQYNRAKKLLWTEHFREASNTYTPDLFDTADLMAIGSRETNLDPKWLTKKGDNGHGAGLMQIDDRSFPEFTNSTKWKDARLGIMYGAKVLRQKWDDLQKNAGKRLTVKQYAFTGPHVSGLIAQQIAIAAYNSGRWAAYHYTKGRHPDHGTTGKDYSSDVMQRARIFRELLAKDGMLDSAAANTMLGSDSAATTKPDTTGNGAIAQNPDGPQAGSSDPPPTVKTEQIVVAPDGTTTKTTIFERLTDWSGKLNIVTGFKDSLNPFTPSISPISGTSGLATVVTKLGGWAIMLSGLIFNRWTALIAGMVLIGFALGYLASAKRNAAKRTGGDAPLQQTNVEVGTTA